MNASTTTTIYKFLFQTTNSIPSKYSTTANSEEKTIKIGILGSGSVLVTTLPSPIIGNDTNSIDKGELPVLPELWTQQILPFLTPVELCGISLVNKEYHTLSHSDLLWKDQCERRWEGKQNVSRFANKNNLSWKQRYAWAESHRLRQMITREELCHFSWKLIYHGRESKLGLRRFRSDGIYESPYAGDCDWTLLKTEVCFLGVSLPVEKDPKTWGWIIGKGHSTVYYSLEE